MATFSDLFIYWYREGKTSFVLSNSAFPFDTMSNFTGATIIVFLYKPVLWDEMIFQNQLKRQMAGAQTNILKMAWTI